MSMSMSKSKSKWSDQDRRGFNEYHDKKTGQVDPESGLGKMIAGYCSAPGYGAFLEVGTWNGWGSTRVFVDALSRRHADHDYVFYSLECNREKQESVKRRYEENESVYIVNDVLAKPSCEEVAALFPAIHTESARKEWFSVDNHNIDQSGLFWDRGDVLPHFFDVVFLDGGEFSTYFDFQTLRHKANVLIVTDIHSPKCNKMIEELLGDPDWMLAASIEDRGATAVFERRAKHGSHEPFVKRHSRWSYESVPVVIHHTGGTQEYFTNSVKLNARRNDVIVIGDDANKDLDMFVRRRQDKHAIEHVHIDKLRTAHMTAFEEAFVNYSFQPENFELQCFLRMFYLRELMRQRKLARVFYVDSDCVTLCDISETLRSLPDLRVGYSMQKSKQEADPYHMTACIHNALLTPDMCDRFIKLCFDIYVSRTKYSLIESKWKHHQKVLAGGVCDMTLWYLYDSQKGEGGEQVSDLNDLYMVDGEKCTFDHNVNDPYGFAGNDTYVTNYNMDTSRWADTKQVVRRDDKYYAVTKAGEEVRLLTIHYQGGAKEGLARNVHGI